jgi:hypothetical protein
MIGAILIASGRVPKTRRIFTKKEPGTLERKDSPERPVEFIVPGDGCVSHAVADWKIAFTKDKWIDE